MFPASQNDWTETLLDLVLATAIFLWALTQGVLPSLHVLPSIPAFDWGWLFRDQRRDGDRGCGPDPRRGLVLALGLASWRKLQAARGTGLRDPA